MASVQELLAAADAQKSPFVSLLEGLTQGVGQGLAAAPARNRAMLETEMMRQQAEREKEMSDQLMQVIKGKQDAATQDAFNGVGAPGTPATPAMRLAGVTTDDKGYLKPRFEVVAPKAKAGTPEKYRAADGTIRWGSWENGKLIQSPDDALAPDGAGSGQNLTPDEIQALSDATMRKENPLAPSLIAFRGPRAKIMANNLMLDPNWSPNAAESGLAGAKTGAEATARVKGGKGFEVAANVGSLDDTLRQMEPLVAQLSPTSMGVLNDAWQKGLASTNDASANQVLGLANSARGLYSQVIAGGHGTVESDKKANETIGRGLNSDGFRGMKAAVMAEGYTRAARLTGTLSGAPEKPAGYVDAAAPAGGGAAHPLVGTKVGKFTITAVQ